MKVGTAARTELLNKAIDAQKDKITTLEAALKNAAESFGENDRRTQNWAVQLNNAKAELNGMEKELDETANSADDLGDELVESGEAAEKSGGKFEKLGGVLKGIGAAMGAVALAAGAAAVKLGKEVIAAYADYEQLVGGMDLLFMPDAMKAWMRTVVFALPLTSVNRLKLTVTQRQ